MEVSERINILGTGDMLSHYRILGFLGKGGFGVTYLALDTKLDLKVAIKEYMPEQVAKRGADNSIQPNTSQDDSIFDWGLERFIKEAQTLAKFNHPNIVRVMAVLELNGTAYMVMEYERGEELKHFFLRPENRNDTTLKRILRPIIDGLTEVHRHGYIHRDIKPTNIIIRKNGTPVLLDFGSARKSNMDTTSALTALVSVGYAPLEQYNETSDKQQGPWTDIYALAAVLYFTITGNPPVASTLRGSAVLNDRTDPLLSLQSIRPEGFSESFCIAIDWALSFKIADRPQTLAEWRRHLLADDETLLRPRPGPRSEDDLTLIAPPKLQVRQEPKHQVSNSRKHANHQVSKSRKHANEELGDEPWDTAGHAGQRYSEPLQAKTAGKRSLWPVLAIVFLAASGLVIWQFQSEISNAFIGDQAALAETAARQAELERQQVEELARQAELEREQAEATRQSELEREQAEAARQAELDREQAEAARQAELDREQAEAARQAELDREQAEAARQAELEREQAEAARQAELEREQAEAARQAELEREQAEAARQAELDREQAEAARQAELEREQAEAARQAELEREQAEAARQAELAREQAEAELSPITDADMSLVLTQFNRLTQAIRSRDIIAVRALTNESERNYAYFEYLFGTYDRIDVAMTAISASRLEQKISGVLNLKQMYASNGNAAPPPPEFERIRVHVVRRGQWSNIMW